MKEKISKKMLHVTGHPPQKEEFQEMSNEDRDLYLFLRGGFSAK